MGLSAAIVKEEKKQKNLKAYNKKDPYTEIEKFLLYHFVAI